MTGEGVKKNELLGKQQLQHDIDNYSTNQKMFGSLFFQLLEKFKSIPETHYIYMGKQYFKIPQDVLEKIMSEWVETQRVKRYFHNNRPYINMIHIKYALKADAETLLWGVFHTVPFYLVTQYLYLESNLQTGVFVEPHINTKKLIVLNGDTRTAEEVVGLKMKTLNEVRKVNHKEYKRLYNELVNFDYVLFAFKEDFLEVEKAFNSYPSFVNVQAYVFENDMWDCVLENKPIKSRQFEKRAVSEKEGI